MKLLVIRLDSMGEVILTTPVVRCLKKQIQGAEIHYLIQPAYKTIIENNPYIDKIHLLKKAKEQTVNELNEENFDFVIDLQNNTVTKEIIKQSGLTVLSFDKRVFETLVFVNLKWNLMPRMHIADLFMKTVRSLGIRNDGLGLDYFIPANEEIQQKDIPTSHQAGFICLAIGASHFTKKLPFYKLIDLCKKINHPVILLGGPEDADAGYMISKSDPGKIYNACGKFSYNENADLIRRSKLLFSNDAGHVQLAAAFKKQVIIVWGSTSSSFGETPYYDEQFLLRNAAPFDNIYVNKLWCRPCTSKGKNNCPLGHFKCMKKIDIDEIARRVSLRLAR